MAISLSANLVRSICPYTPEEGLSRSLPKSRPCFSFAGLQVRRLRAFRFSFQDRLTGASVSFVSYIALCNADTTVSGIFEGFGHGAILAGL